MIVPVTKTVTLEVPNGEMHITQVDDSYFLEYHNTIYKGSPFKLTMQFSTSFSIPEILNSSEVIGFLSRFQ